MTILNQPQQTQQKQQQQQQQPHLTSLVSSNVYHLVVLGFCYRRIVYILSLFPIGLITVPIISSFVANGFDFISSGLGCICLALTVIGTIIIQQCIYQLTKDYTKNTYAYDNAIVRNRLRIPFVMIIISSIICHYIIFPILSVDDYSTKYIIKRNEYYYDDLSKDTTIRLLSYLSLTTLIPSLRFCFQLALISFILGLSVIFRYVGPNSIMRCSSVPLRTNPLRAKLRYLFNNPWSIILQSSSSPSVTNTSSINSQQVRQEQNSLNQQGTATTTTTITSIDIQPPPLFVPPNTPYTIQSNNEKLREMMLQQHRHHNSVVHDSERENNYTGRRYELPTIRTTIVQVFVPIIIGILISYIINSIILDNKEMMQLRTAPTSMSTFPLAIICILSTLSPTLLTIAGGNAITMSHEINIKLYMYPFSCRAEWTEIIRSFVMRICSVAILCSVIAVTIFESYNYIIHTVTYTTEIGGARDKLISSPRSILYWVICSLLINIYIYTQEELLKLHLLSCMKKGVAGGTKRIVDEIQYDTTYSSTLLVFLRSLLPLNDTTDDEIVQYIMKTMTDAVSVNNKSINRIEIEDAEKCMRIVSYRMLSSSTIFSFNVPLEEDVFRTILLESIGGGSKDVIDDSNCISQRHNEEVSNWIFNQQQNKMVETGVVNREHRDIVRSFIRLLAVHTGSFGYALSRISTTTSSIGISGTTKSPVLGNQTPTPLSDSYNYCTWSLSTSSITCIQFAIRGMTRCILKSFQQPQANTVSRTALHTVAKTNTSSSFLLGDWTNSIVAPVIPIAIMSLFSLRVGLVQYLHYYRKNNLSSSSTDDNRVPLSDDIMRLVEIADNSALSIMRTICSFGATSANILATLGLADGAVLWAQDLMSSLHAPSASPRRIEFSSLTE